MKLAVVYATVGRPDILAGALACLREQTRAPDRIVVSAVTADDAPSLPQGMPIDLVFGDKGLPAQRNTALRVLGRDADIVIFFDDDFAPAPSYLGALEQIFESNPGIVGVTGNVVADGIGGPGYTFEDALRFLSGFEAKPLKEAVRRPVASLYGCNMAFRTCAAAGLTFDEALPLYAWQEDVDFTMQLGRRGQMIWSEALGGVHLGVKRARTPGLAMGYAQIANPIFLRRKKTMAASHAYSLMARNLAANLVRSLRPEPWCDRRGRLAGNMKAVGDLLRGGLHPKNILDLK